MIQNKLSVYVSLSRKIDFNDIVHSNEKRHDESFH